MKNISARKANINFGQLIDTARGGPAVIETHGRGMMVAAAMEEYDGLDCVADEFRQCWGGAETVSMTRLRAS